MKVFQWTEHKYFKEYLKMGDWQSAIDVENESHEQEIDPQLSAQIIKMTNEKAEIDHARSHLVSGSYLITFLIKFK